MLDRTGSNRLQVLEKYCAGSRKLFQLADLVQTFVEFFRIENLDERFKFIKNNFVFLKCDNFSLAVDRAQELFSKLDADNDGDITEEEFLSACLEDESLSSSLGTKLAFSGPDPKEEDKEDREGVPRFSLSAENRVTTKRRFSDICTKKNLIYNS